MSPRTLVLDFDGTVCVGDGPVLLYAQEVTRRTGLDVGSGVEHFLRTGQLPPDGAHDAVTDAARVRVPPEDGYQAVVALVRAGARRDPSRLDVGVLDAAYRASRARFAQDGAGTWAPEGLGAFLRRVRSGGTRVVLVTNSPLTGVSDWLERQGLVPLLDHVVPDAGKPAAMAGILRRLLAGAGAAPDTLVSVGDVHANDISPALAVGARGAHIDRWAARPGPATWSARSFTGLFEPIAAWSAGDDRFVESIL